VCVPVENEDQVTGILFTMINLNSFTEKFVNPVKVGENGYAKIYTKDLVIISHPDKQRIFKTSPVVIFKDAFSSSVFGFLPYENIGEKKFLNFHKISHKDMLGKLRNFF